QQYVRLGGYRLRLEVVRLVVEDRVHLLGRDELMYVDATTGGERQVSEVLVVEDHHLAAAEVVALGDVVVGDLFTVDAADALVLDPAAVLAVHLMEPDVLFLRRRVELDPDGD